jgi:hypothetical protein
MVRLFEILFGLLLNFGFLSCQDYQNKSSPKREVENENKFYTNPIVNRNFPDPVDAIIVKLFNN